MSDNYTTFHATTICGVKKNGKTAIAGDGQVTMGESVIFKNSAQKVRRIYGGKVILGFAGSVSDAFSLSEKFEGMQCLDCKRRQLRFGGGARAFPEYGFHCRGNCEKSFENSKRNLCVYQRQY